MARRREPGGGVVGIGFRTHAPAVAGLLLRDAAGAVVADGGGGAEAVDAARDAADAALGGVAQAFARGAVGRAQRRVLRGWLDADAGHAVDAAPPAGPPGVAAGSQRPHVRATAV